MTTDRFEQSIAQIERLAKLREAAALSDEEFAAEKARVLNRRSDASAIAWRWVAGVVAVLLPVVLGAVWLGRDAATQPAPLPSPIARADRSRALPTAPEPVPTPVAPSRDLSLDGQTEVRNADDVVFGGRVHVSQARLPAGSSWHGLRLGRLIAEHGSYPETDDYD